MNSCFKILWWGQHNDLKVPEKPQTRCTGLNYFGSKSFNKLPKNIKGAQTTNFFKNLLKEWIWKKTHHYYKSLTKKMSDC